MCMYIGTLLEITFVDVMRIKKCSLSQGTHREMWPVKHLSENSCKDSLFSM